MVMHVMVSDEIMNGLKMIKYASNHWWKFDAPFTAALSGVFQSVALVIVAIVNYHVLLISTNVLNVAKDFMALMIIANFD